MQVKLRTVESIVDDVEAMRQRIAARAAEVFRRRGGAIGHALEDWLQAERETVWRPAMEVRRTRDAFIVRVAAAGLDPKLIDLRVTPTELLLAADVHHDDPSRGGETLRCEFATGPLFRDYTFPEPVDAARVTAEYRNGMLSVTAPLAHPATRVHVEAA